MDTTDRDRALEDLELERKLRKKVELELSEYKFKLQLACSDAQNLRDELNSLKACISAPQTTQRVLSSMYGLFLLFCYYVPMVFMCYVYLILGLRARNLPLVATTSSSP